MLVSDALLLIQKLSYFELTGRKKSLFVITYLIEKIYFFNYRVLLRTVLTMNMWLFPHISLSKDKQNWALESK